MHTQLPSDMANIREVVYSLWRNMLSEENVSQVGYQKSSAKFVVTISPTSSSYDENRIQGIAGHWENIVKNIPKPPQSGQSTISSLEPELSSYLPGLDEEVREYGLRNNILPDILNYYRQIYKTFDRIEEIQITLISDYEIENYHKIRFNLKIKSSIENLLRKEAEFKKTIRNLISRESRMNFVLTTQIV